MPILRDAEFASKLSTSPFPPLINEEDSSHKLPLATSDTTSHHDFDVHTFKSMIVAHP